MPDAKPSGSPEANPDRVPTAIRGILPSSAEQSRMGLMPMTSSRDGSNAPRWLLAPDCSSAWRWNQQISYLILCNVVSFVKLLLG